MAVRLRSVPDSISTARGAAREALERWQLDHLTDTVTLLVSELTTNVVLHARTDFEVRVERLRERVRITVLDGSPREAVLRRYGLHAGTGRGLGLVDTLAWSWRCEPADAPWAKAVWFELSDDAEAQAGTDEGALYGEDWLALVEDL